ncbi:hypothetical protein HN840_03655 [archaeon]|nr:hypothetical protein [archaeon]
MKKILSILIMALCLLTVPTLAEESTNYAFQNIYVDGVGYTVDSSIYVERGDEITVRVYIEGLDETKDVQIKTWLGGYEYDTVQETSSMFDVEAGVIYGKTLNLALPSDLNADQEYTLYVEVFDETDSITATTTILVSNERHLLSVQDVLINDAEAGDYASATVRLENMGDHKEEDIKVTLTIAELDIEVSEYLNELTNNEIDNEDEESSGEVSLTYQIPDCADDGDYEAVVTVSYNEGYDTLEETVSFNVDSSACEVSSEDDDSTVTVVVTDDSNDDEEVENTDFSTALRLGFGILAVLIVILALILIVRR